MIITKKSQLSGKVNSMDLDVTQEALDRWKGGELIQDVFPDLTPSEREFLITGILGDEWDTIFSINDY